MPHALMQVPVLSLAAGAIAKVDNVDCDKLSMLWNVFTKCAENLENGRRLENLSWRLWYRECQIDEREKLEAHQRLRRRASEGNDASPPALCSSIDTIQDGETTHEPVGREAARRESDCAPTTRKHLTPHQFRELVTQFGKDTMTPTQWTQVKQRALDRKRQQQLDDASTVTTSNADRRKMSAISAAPRALSHSQHQIRAQSPLSVSNVQMRRTEQPPRRSATTDSARRVSAGPGVRRQDSLVLDCTSAGATEGLRRASSVVHGFNPGCSLVTHSPIQRPTVHSAKHTDRHIFFLQSSPSESDDESEREPSVVSLGVAKRSATTFDAVGKENIEHTTDQSLKSRSATFKEVVDQGSGYESSPFDSDDETDIEGAPAPTPSCLVRSPRRESVFASSVEEESAIISDSEDEADDDFADEDAAEDDEWASVASDSRTQSIAGTSFDEVESRRVKRPKMSNRTSLLSTMLTDGCVRTLTNAQSKSSPAIAQSRPPSPSSVRPSVAPRDLQSEPLGCAVPTQIRGAISPRSTRRNMMARELSESLRRHLLWERKQKPAATASQAPGEAALQRRHTVYDLSRLKDYPELKSELKAGGDEGNLPSMDQEYGYHQVGW